MRKTKLKKLFSKPCKILIPILIVAILLSTTTLGNVNTKWDWHLVDGGQHKRTIHWCWCPESYEYLASHPEWINWMVVAVQNWNNANSGWNIEFTDNPELCQLCIAFGDIECPGSGSARDINDDGWLKKGRITFDTNLKNNPKDPASGWGTTGDDVYDPIVVAKHELGHFLRLNHGTGDDMMDVDGPGNHNHELSPHDIQEAKDSNSSVGKKITNVFHPFGYFESENNDTIFIPEGALPGDDPLNFKNVIDWEIPYATNIGNSYISTAIEISTDSGFLNLPIGISMAYTDGEIAGGNVCYVDQYYPPLIESSLFVCKFNPDTEMWEPYLPSVVDPTMNQVIFDTVELGIFGITGQPEFEITPPPTPGQPNGPSSGKTGIEYTYSIQVTNPTGDQMNFWFDWGDDSGTGWIGPYSSGETCEADHIWSEKGSYEIKVRAENEWGWESDWSEPLTITIKKSRSIATPLLELLEDYPILYQILRVISQRLGL